MSGDFEVDESHVWLLIEDKSTVMGVYAHELDAATDVYRMGPRYRAERWAIDFEPMCPESTDS
jgi:hypothetical protein